MVAHYTLRVVKVKEPVYASLRLSKTKVSSMSFIIYYLLLQPRFNGIRCRKPNVKSTTTGGQLRMPLVVALVSGYVDDHQCAVLVPSIEK
jgi:hypothetical protein